MHSLVASGECGPGRLGSSGVADILRYPIHDQTRTLRGEQDPGPANRETKTC